MIDVPAAFLYEVDLNAFNLPWCLYYLIINSDICFLKFLQYCKM
ncbi:hypothetical protein O93_00449, partial [Bartonella quintana JK 19]